jgi:hypothetical protein
MVLLGPDLSVFVMPGLVPGIYVFLYNATDEDVDGRVKPGHDE